MSPIENSVCVCTISSLTSFAILATWNNPLKATLLSVKDTNGTLATRKIFGSTIFLSTCGSVVVKIKTECPCCSNASFKVLIEVATPDTVSYTHLTLPTTPYV